VKQYAGNGRDLPAPDKTIMEAANTSVRNRRILTRANCLQRWLRYLFPGFLIGRLNLGILQKLAQWPRILMKKRAKSLVSVAENKFASKRVARIACWSR